MIKEENEIHRKYHRHIFEKMEQEPFAQFLGIQLIEIGEGTARAELDVRRQEMLNSHGTIHGAVIFALADYVFASACNSYGKTAVGLSTTINFISAAKKGDILEATAMEEKRNHRIGWYKINVTSKGELIATMEAIAYRKKEYFIEDQ